jgi:hypothetical protein
MFRSTSSRLRSWWSATSGDLLGGDITYEHPLDHHLNHPHRRALHRPARRRAGAVAARPAHCISPVRASSSAVRSELPG